MVTNDPLVVTNVMACAAIVLRLMMFRKPGGRHNPWASWLAYVITRKLPPVSRLAYSGLKLGKHGVEITAISRERMYEAVMKRLGLADSEFAQQLQQIEIERRQLEIEKLRKELAADPEDDEPLPVAININVADARVRNDDDGDIADP